MALSEKDEAKLAELNIDPKRLDADTESKAKDTADLQFKGKDPPDTSEETGEGDYVSRAEITDFVKSVGDTQTQLVQVVAALAESVKSLEANKLAVDKETLEATPAASLTELHKSIIGSPETKVDGRSSLAKSGPEEAPMDGGAGSRYGGGITALIGQRNQEIERGGVQ